MTPQEDTARTPIPLDISAFQEYVFAVRLRADRLLEQLQDVNAKPYDKMFSSLALELMTAVEGLQSADAELHQQNEALEDAYRALEVERARYQNLFQFAPNGYLVTNGEGIIREANSAAAALINIDAHHMIGKPLSLYLSRDDVSPFRQRLFELHTSTYPIEWEVMLRPRHQEAFPVLLTAIRTECFGYTEEVCISWIVRSIESHKKIQADLERRVEERTIDLMRVNTALKQEVLERERAQLSEHQQRVHVEALHEATLALARVIDLPQVLDQIMSQLGQVLPYDIAAVLLLEDESVRVVSTRGLRSHNMDKQRDHLLDHSLPLHESTMLSHMIRTHQPYVKPCADAPDTMIELLPDVMVASCASTPLIAFDNVIGFLLLGSLRVNVFQPAHASQLGAFATAAAVALHTAALYEQGLSLATLEERQRLARELHDAVTQTLFTASLLAEALQMQMPDAPPQAQQTIKDLRTLNRAALAEMRMLLMELRPNQLTHISLAELLGHLVSALHGRTEIDVDLTIDDGDPLPPDIQIVLYRIAQEALNNIIKYAQASKVAITYISEPGQANLTVEDNGVGFDLESYTPGIGIESMRERAAGIGARFTLDTQPGQGTRVHVEWDGATPDSSK